MKMRSRRELSIVAVLEEIRYKNFSLISVLHFYNLGQFFFWIFNIKINDFKKKERNSINKNPCLEFIVHFFVLLFRVKVSTELGRFKLRPITRCLISVSLWDLIRTTTTRHFNRKSSTNSQT